MMDKYLSYTPEQRERFDKLAMHTRIGHDGVYKASADQTLRTRAREKLGRFESIDDAMGKLAEQGLIPPRAQAKAV